MTKLLSLLAITGSVAAVECAAAAERTVSFAVEGMTCAADPYVVKTSMSVVPGVTDVAISYFTKTATVTFDDAKTTADAIGTASTYVGFPARPMEPRS